MENQLVRTDKFMFKVKRFFRLLFMKKNSQIPQELTEENIDINEELNKVISCKTEAQEVRIRVELAEKLTRNELPIKDLSDEEIEQMIQYFKDHIKIKTEELENIKKEIVKLKKESK